MVEADRLGRPRAVRLAQRRPAVRALQELVREAEREAGRRRLEQVGDAVDAQGLGFGPRHRQRVGVVEAERNRGLQLARCEPAIQLLERRIAVTLEQLANDRSGVLGVQVDRTAGERLLEDAGVAEAGLVNRGPTRAGKRLRQDLAEHVRLGEPFRADHQGRVGSANPLRQGEADGEGDADAGRS